MIAMSCRKKDAIDQGVLRLVIGGASVVSVLALSACGGASGPAVGLSKGTSGGRGLIWRDTNPVWSPDGPKIAFVSNRPHPGSRPKNIYVMNSDGSGARR